MVYYFLWERRGREKERKREEIYTGISANAWIFIGRISKKLGTVCASREGNWRIEKKERQVLTTQSFTSLYHVCVNLFYMYRYVHTYIILKTKRNVALCPRRNTVSAIISPSPYSA